MTQVTYSHQKRRCSRGSHGGEDLPSGQQRDAWSNRNGRVSHVNLFSTNEGGDSFQSMHIALSMEFSMDKTLTPWTVVNIIETKFFTVISLISHSCIPNRTYQSSYEVRVCRNHPSLLPKEICGEFRTATSKEVGSRRCADRLWNSFGRSLQSKGCPFSHHGSGKLPSLKLIFRIPNFHFYDYGRKAKSCWQIWRARLTTGSEGLLMIVSWS